MVWIFPSRINHIERGIIYECYQIYKKFRFLGGGEKGLGVENYNFFQIFLNVTWQPLCDIVVT